MALRTPFELLRNRRLAALENSGARWRSGGRGWKWKPCSNSSIRLKTRGGKFRTVNFNGFGFFAGFVAIRLLPAGIRPSPLHTGKRWRRSRCDRGYRPPAAPTSMPAFIAAGPTGASRMETGLRTAEQLQRFAVSTPQQFGRGPMCAVFSPLPLFMPSRIRPWRLQEHVLQALRFRGFPPRDVMLKFGEQCLGRREGIRALFLP